MSTTHLVAISNQVRQRNECYKHFVKGFFLRKHSNKEMGKACVKMAKNDPKYFSYITNVKGSKKRKRVNFAYMTPVKVIYSGTSY